MTAFLFVGGCQATRGHAKLSLAHWGTPRTALQRFDPSDSLQRSAASDPLGFLIMCREHYQEHFADYRCRFIKRERLKGVLRPVEEMEVCFREHPYSVDVRWLSSTGQAKRVNYVAGRWSHRGKEYALIEPAGLLGLLAPQGVRRDIQAPDVRAAARATIDEFGFHKTLEDIIRYCELARSDADYDLRFTGTTTLDGRPCLVLERRLPYCCEGGRYPNRLLVIYVDREWLVPVACFAYADDEGRKLLGSYVTTDVQFNLGLTDASFE